MLRCMDDNNAQRRTQSHTGGEGTELLNRHPEMTLRSLPDQEHAISYMTSHRLSFGLREIRPRHRAYPVQRLLIRIERRVLGEGMILGSHVQDGSFVLVQRPPPESRTNWAAEALLSDMAYPVQSAIRSHRDSSGSSTCAERCPVLPMASL